MAIQFVVGSTGTGKTVHIMDEMFRLQQEGLNETQLFIVPEQYTLKAQEEFILHTKANGLLHIEVLSFNRLVNRFFDDLGIAHKKIVSDFSMSMMIRKIIQQHSEAFVWLSKNCKQQSFIEEITQIVKECYQYNLTAEQLFLLGDDIQEQLLKDKINDLSKLLNYFNQEQKEAFITQDEALHRLCQSLPTEPMLNKASVFIDGFYGFTPLQYQIIETFMRTSPKVTFCVTIPSDAQLGDLKDETDLFYESKKMISALRDLAEVNSISELPMIKCEYNQRKQHDALLHLTQNILRYPVKSWDKCSKHLRFLESSSIQDEVEVVALRIHQLIYEKNYRYKDIVVLTSDLQSYEEDIRIIFDEYLFNYFLDRKEGISNHPIVQFILSALLINQYNFRYEHIFYHLKSIFYTEQSTVEIIENWCLRRGIKGYNRWNDLWDVYEFEKKELMDPIFQFHTRMNASSTVQMKIKSLYQLLEATHIIEKCSIISESLVQKGKYQEAQTYEQVYSLILDMLDQMVDLIGEEVIERKDFASLIETGLSQVKLGQTPTNVDQLLVGQVNRSRFKEVKAIFVLGMNEGKIPLILTSSTLLTDHERTVLSSKGVELAPTKEKSLFKEQMAIYIALTRCTHLLHLSFSRQGSEEALRPAPLMMNLIRMFPNVGIEKAEEVLKNNLSFTRVLPLYKKLIRLVTEDSYQQHETTINLLYNLLKKVYNYLDKGIFLEPEVFIKGLNYDNTTVQLEQLKDTIYELGVSELETYSTCPYQHFLNYRLKINERQEYIVSMPDIGNLFHECLEAYLKKCFNRQLDISNVEQTLRNTLIEECINELLCNEKYAIFQSTYQNQYLIIKLTRILKRAIWGIEQHISQHILRPKELEYKFSGKSLEIDPLRLYVSQGTQLFLKGVVDRIDEFETDSALYYRIIDYKSSQNDLDFNLVNKGVQLQLYVYLDVIKSIKEHGTTKKVIPVGLYYYHISDPYLRIDEENTHGDVFKEDEEADSFKQERLKALAPKGLALNNDLMEELTHLENESLTDLEKECVKKALNTNRATVLSQDELDTTLQFIHKKTEDISKAIYEGRIPIKPYRYGQTTSCDYCEYKGICRFDSTNSSEKYEHVAKESKEDIVRYMKGVIYGGSNSKNHSN
jgi:ATP-dependent helicase/nuclease subunit B